MTSLSTLSPSDRERLEALIQELKRRKHQELCRKSFLAFVKHMWSDVFVQGRHHTRIAHEFELIEEGGDGRLIINLPPRHTKSMFASVFFPAWYLGKHPDRKIIQCSVTAELAVTFGRQVRNLVNSEKFREIFPTVELQQDSKAAGRWATNMGGFYFACGTSGSVTGQGADLLLVDDPVDEQMALQAITTPEVYDKVWEWFESGPRQRLQPGGNIIVLMTRWSLRDLTGKLLQKMALKSGDTYKHISFPAILPSGNPVWPEYWSIEALLATKNAISTGKWQSQYQQNPVSEENALVKRSDWQIWPKDTPPTVEFVLQTMDTAFEKNQRADYSAIITWGVFTHDDETGVGQSHIIMLDAHRERCEFPRLKQMAKEKYGEYDADCLLIEKRATGAPLIYELRSAGIPCSEFTPTRQTGDKLARLAAVSDLFNSGRVWAPDRRWAEEVIDEVASFPNSDHDDYCLVAGTQIRMADGSEKSIETIQAGEWVWTPMGAQPVTAAGQTGFTQTLTLTTQSGHLTGTANHPISKENIWTPLTNIKQGDTIDTLSTEGVLWQQREVGQTGSWLHSTVRHIKNTATGRIMSGLEVSISYIEMCGSSIMGPFPKGIISTTLTATGPIMSSATLRCFPQRTTGMSTPMSAAPIQAGPNSLRISRLSDHLPRRGTPQKKASCGIKSTLRYYISRVGQKTSRMYPHSKKFVRPAEKSTFQKIQSALYIVVKRARVKPITTESGLSVWQLAHRIACAAVPLSFRLGKSKNTVTSSVVVTSITLNSTPCAVYNLTVANAHAYYANGILTHNCDCVSLALGYFRKGGFIRAAMDMPDEIKYFKSSKKMAYY